ncbi:MAG: PilZ domain-containing protein, partial [Planctomycetota bacterium]|nr:PilZ domain-containing protein [Planctomycetota bacterium]
DLPAPGRAGKEKESELAAAERRRSRRVSTDLPIAVFLQRPHSSIWSDENVPATAKNLSKGGICLIVSRDLSHEKRLRIKLSYPRLRLMLDAVAEIVRVTPVGDKFEIGAKYLFVGAEREVTR